MQSGMNDLLLLQDVATRLAQYTHNDTLVKQGTYDELAERLTQHLVFLLLNQMEELLQLLYRVDVAEQDAKMAFEEQSPELIAPRLAKLIIAREWQKAKTRVQYRTDKN
jgi:hypothetical protein